jgi:hypothetical protein
MIMSWWWLWVLFMVVFLFTPVSYGWGYRRWGPPYPRYLQRRRSERASDDRGGEPFDHHAWGWGGDFLWIIFFIWIVWLVAALWRP